MDQPLISIAIPTFDRDRYLEEMLRSLAPQMRRHPGRVEVVISDNASTDRTEAVVRSLSPELGGIRYRRNERNLGVVANYWLAFRLARGKFVCVAGDDDIYEDYFLDLAIAVINSLDPDLLLFNRSIWNRDMSECILDRLMAIESGLVYGGIMDLARAHGLASNLAFISAVLFRRMPAMAAPSTYSLQIGFPYPQIEIYLRAFHEGRCAVVPQPALRQRQFNGDRPATELRHGIMNGPIGGSIGWIQTFLHLHRQGLIPFRSLFETREFDPWLTGTMADFIIPNIARAMHYGVLELDHVACILEAMPLLPDGELKQRLLECVAVAVDQARLAGQSPKAGLAT